LCGYQFELRQCDREPPDIDSVWGLYADSWVRAAEGRRTGKRLYRTFLSKGPASISTETAKTRIQDKASGLTADSAYSLATTSSPIRLIIALDVRKVGGPVIVR
jgi:hypothetical protein